MSKCRNWCFTVNRDLEIIKPDMTIIKYIVMQIEVSPTTGHDHIQGYAELNEPTRMQAFITALGYSSGRQVHVEKRRGTASEAREYCMKDDTRKPGSNYVELGEWNVKKQGKRSDLEEACKVAKEHGMKRVAEECPSQFVKYHKGLDAYRKILRPHRKYGDYVEVHVRWGLTGTGKSHYVHEKYGDSLYVKPPGNKWWDHYDGEEVVLIDDFDGGIDYRSFLTWTDKYPAYVETKGGTMRLNARVIYITSNVYYSHWWPNETIGPLERRIKSVEYLDKKYVPSTALIVQPKHCMDCGQEQSVCGSCLD
nr:MAG: replication associated protein [Cressdnaviricota sp.]